jgi:hypothetical protein
LAGSDGTGPAARGVRGGGGICAVAMSGGNGILFTGSDGKGAAARGAQGGVGIFAFALSDGNGLLATGP